MRKSILLALLAGIVTTQLIATFHLLSENLDLYRLIQYLQGQGVETVPNQISLPSLLEWKSAIFGGLFFSLTIGVSIPVFCGVLINFLKWQFQGRISPLISLIFIWITLLLFINFSSFNTFPTIYALLVPIVPTLLLFGVISEPHPKFQWMLKFLPIFLIGGILINGTVPDSNYFTKLRDRLLWSNSIGSIISDFYYRYTYYPAETLKAADKKLVRGVYLEPPDHKLLNQRTRRDLNQRGYYVVPSYIGYEFVIDNSSAFQGQADVVKELLKNHSEKADKLKNWRYFIHLSISISGLTILLFPIIFFGKKRLSWVILYPLLILGIIVWLNIPLDKNLETLQRVAGGESSLKNPELAIKYLTSSDVTDRYWAARAMRDPQSQKSVGYLLKALNDPHPNVVCQALFALGFQNKPSLIPVILQRFQKEEHLYIQLYAFQALRRLGWKPGK